MQAFISVLFIVRPPDRSSLRNAAKLRLFQFAYFFAQGLGSALDWGQGVVSSNHR